MEKIQYVNEHLMPGILGNFFIVLSFVSAFFSMVAYYLATRSGEQADRWIRPARIGFYIHGASVIGMISTLLYILFNHLYEYKYAFDHLNNAMPMKYVFSCMWEGQEGSFLLWIFWHVVLGTILIRSAKAWEPWVMAVTGLVQLFLSSMLIGGFFGDFQFGSNPFLLLREVPSNLGLPWTMNAEYLSLPTFQDGKGLNPLLQNYWMTIHPPTLFLGFAATLIPFVYAIAGMWKGDLQGWMRPAIPWAFFGVMILGTGILMGGAWAYEALGFGGFWAWDPVENASLVPWLTLVGSAHLIVINQRKPTSLFMTLMLTLSSFILVLYSTFLTRSGVLGDSSVHSFVDSGILAQLLVYLLAFIALSTALLHNSRVWRMGYVAICLILFVLGIGNLLTHDSPAGTESESLLPGEGTWIPMLVVVFLVGSLVMLISSYNKRFSVKKEDEEATWSREFWMFIGSLVLTIMAIHVTWVTSINVWNIFLSPFEGMFTSLHQATGWDFLERLARHDFSAPGDKERFTVYHKLQVPLAIVLFLIIAVSQYFKYKNTDMNVFLKKISISAAIAFVITLVVGITGVFRTSDGPLYALLFSTLFAVLSNADYGIRVLKGKLDHIGASVAHVGFAMLILGALVSTSQSHFISRNINGNVADLSEEFTNEEDLMILQGDTLPMGEYFITYSDKYREGERLHVVVEYFSKEPITYEAGDEVQMQGMLFRSMEKHVAGNSFLEDWSVDSLWSMVPMATQSRTAQARVWMPGVPGEKLFELKPSVLMSPKGNSREPSIRHYVGKDLYTFIKFTEMDPAPADTSGWLDPRSGTIEVGKMVRLTESLNLTLDSLVHVENIPDSLPQGLNVDLAYITITDGPRTDRLQLKSVMMGDSISIPFPEESEKFRILLSLANKRSGIELTAQQHSSTKRDMLILSAEVFPQINILWLGCLVMIIGTTMAIRHRYRTARKLSA